MTTLRAAQLGRFAKNRCLETEFGSQQNERLGNRPRPRCTTVHGDEVEEQIARTNLSRDQSGADVKRLGSAWILDGEAVTSKQCGERVGYGPRSGEQLQAVADGTVALRRGASPADIDHAHAPWWERGLQLCPEVLRREVLGQDQGDPFASRGDP